MKKILLFITLFILFIKTLCLSCFAQAEPLKVMSMHYDDSSALVYVTTKDNTPEERTPQSLKFVRLEAPNRIYFDINNAVLIGGKQQLTFEKSPIKEIRLAQFETDPYIVRAVITFEEDFDSSKVELISIGNNIIAKLNYPQIANDYFHCIYNEAPKSLRYNGISVFSQALERTPVSTEQIKAPQNVMDEIEKAFENSTLANSNGKTYESVVSVDVSSNLKLRTEYFINRYLTKNGGLLVSGFGQLSTTKMFYLDSPKRAVIDLPNTYLDKKIRNTEINLCPDGSCNDTAKIGQFEYNTARIVVTSEKAEKYLPIYSQDSQSLFFVDSDKLNHTSLVTNVSNINKAFVRRIDSRTNELILSFSSPVVHSILRTNNSLNLFLFNVQSYNEQDMIKTLASSFYKQFTLSLLPKIGVKAALPINKTDIVKIEQSVDAKAIKITITRGTSSEPKIEKPIKRPPVIKNKIILDAGHGGSDYGAIKEGINEKDITLDVTQRVNAILNAKGYKTALTRRDDSYLSLEERVDFSENESPEIFISIHVNSAVSSDPTGIETHWYHDSGKNLAEIVHKHLIKEVRSAKDRGLFKSKFYVINHSTVPAILCEIGFLSNDSERNDLITESRKQKTAKAIAEGIIEYLQSKGSK
ncbi:MAG: N-acetylmuramoyl-L-alanine amidase [Cyanobacteria bacterium SIG28]|nr:N-acetylmuramoyl-L-alanine amidase [Cyanobacteria bacterium SIG28]